MKKTVFATTLAAVLLPGCAHFGAAPDAGLIDRVPVVTYPARPSGPDYVYRIPAGQPVTLTTTVQGTLLQAPASQPLQAAVRNDLYLYKDWASEDGRHWVRGLVNGRVDVSLPSYQTPGPGSVRIVVDHADGH
jgi:hypothetical protein